MKRTVLSFVAALALAMPVTSLAQDKPADKAATGGQAAPGGNGGGNRQRGQNGGGRFGGQQGGAFGGAGGIAGALARDPLQETISILGELNLASDFTLTSDQKEKIQAARDEYKKQMDKWRTEHEAELKKIQDQFGELRRGGQQGGGGVDRDKVQEIMKARQDLQATAPKADETVATIKGILTTEQLKKLEVKQAERPQRPTFGGNAQQGRQRGQRGQRGGGAGA